MAHLLAQEWSMNGSGSRLDALPGSMCRSGHVQRESTHACMHAEFTHQNQIPVPLHADAKQGPVLLFSRHSFFHITNIFHNCPFQSTQSRKFDELINHSNFHFFLLFFHFFQRWRHATIAACSARKHSRIDRSSPGDR